jgi:hypothetical protein
MDIFDFTEGFSPDEQGMNEPYVLSGFILMVLHFLRLYIRILDPTATITIHASVASGGHSTTSQHYKPRACALDFRINSVIPYKELIEHVEAFLDKFQIADRVGLGIYPDWNSPGFHLDSRGTRARWGYLLKDNGKGKLVQTAVSYDEAREYAMTA